MTRSRHACRAKSPAAKQCGTSAPTNAAGSSAPFRKLTMRGILALDTSDLHQQRDCDIGRSPLPASPCRRCEHSPMVKPSMTRRAAPKACQSPTSRPTGDRPASAAGRFRESASRPPRYSYGTRNSELLAIVSNSANAAAGSPSRGWPPSRARRATAARQSCTETCGRTKLVIFAWKTSNTAPPWMWPQK